MKSFKILAALAITVPLLFGTASAGAQEQVTLAANVKVERTELVDGVEQKVLAEPDDVVPGDRLVFSTSYHNAGSEVVDNFVVTNPLPGAVVLAEDSSAFLVSTDGGTSFAALSGLTVPAEPTGTRPAMPSDVTHIRWTLARLEPGASGSLSYNAFVR
jgi:uncharacterized repeat protein (TIGR01451 family)